MIIHIRQICIRADLCLEKLIMNKILETEIFLRKGVWKINFIVETTWKMKCTLKNLWGNVFKLIKGLERQDFCTYKGIAWSLLTSQKTYENLQTNGNKVSGINSERV